MSIEDELVKGLSRRKFLAGLGLSAGSILLARQAVLQTRAEDSARQAEGVTGFGSGPGDADSFASLLSPIGAPATYLRSDGSRASWVNPFTTDFDSAYVQKSPTAPQIIKSIKANLGIADDLIFISRSNAVDAFRIQREDTPNFESAFYPNQNRLRLPDGSSEVTVPFAVEFLPSGTVVSILFTDTIAPNSEIVWGDSTQPTLLNNQRFELPKGGGSGSKFAFSSDTFNFASLSDNVSTGGAVGQPTGIAGTGEGVIRPTHRHAFSGRFSKSGFIRDASLGGATPAKFERIISANNWTLRRISVYALTAPAGTGSDTYGVVNAAGTLQGTAVSLAVGVQENATALQVTNLTGGTVYYIAVTARATTPALDVNVEVEYTMNV